MKKVKVIVKDKALLELAEDASKGDLIDLGELVQVDTSYLENVINSGKERIYAEKLEEAKKAINAENQVNINKLLNEIENLKRQNESNLRLKEKEISNSYIEAIGNLKQQIEVLKNQSSSNLKLKEQEVSQAYSKTIADLKQEIELLKQSKSTELEALKNKNYLELEKEKNESLNKYNALEQKYNLLNNQHENLIKQTKLEAENILNAKLADLNSKYQVELEKKKAELEKLELQYSSDKEKALNEQKNHFDEELKAKEDIINNLQRAKASMNVKQTGEDLEAWCNNEVIQYMQNGLFNCTWTKDNIVVKEEDESKGSKADYIFKIYASSKHLDNELLTSVCLDMKDENPDSVNKKANADYYKALDKNRDKKNCKYAVLVSNLEMDKPNDLPIFKVLDYENMYVVRPAYMMTFLNMIASLTTRFADLVLSKEAEKLELKGKFDLLNEFEDIKNTYLDKPLTLLENALDEISKNSENIKKACRNIDEQMDKITRSYISQITEKLNKFELKLTKDIAKKIEE